jgi:F0F1-type ATP synthase gamma subunit
MQITSAMKMVSAAKLKKAQDAITAMRPYAEKLTELLQNFLLLKVMWEESIQHNVK